MPSTDLRLAIVPIDMIPGDTAANLDSIESKIASLPADTDLVVLPEMCNTGYTIDPGLVERYAEPSDGYTLTRLRAIAASRNIAIWGTIAVADGGRFYNRGFMIDPSGHTDYYDKRHLFVLGREPMLYTPGEAQAPIVTFRGWKIKMSICYDLRFPVWTRWTDEAPYDLLVIPANWPDAREFAWRNLLLARAIENQAYVAGCNRLGSDLYGSYRHDISYLFNHWGDEIGRRDNATGIITATLDGKSLDHDRARFPNLAAADDFVISMQ